MLDFVICTYNRINSVKKLVGIIQSSYFKYVNKIIIVDSTDYEKTINLSEGKLIHIVTRHKNQPYQRYLGFCASDADFLIFLDDDMEITNNNFISKTLDLFKRDDIVALAFNFIDKHSETSLSKIPDTMFLGRNKPLKKVKNFFTGYPNTRLGKYGLCGTRGSKLNSDGFTELIGGGAFAVKRKAIYKNFNYQLFDIYENNLGKGEDGILGYTLSKQGNLFFVKENYFMHNDQLNSAYSADIFKFAQRVSFSRLYLSLEKFRLDKRCLFIARLHYHYYMFWRFAGLFMNYIIDPGKVRWKILKGTLIGWHKALFFKFSLSEETARYWHSEAVRDMRGSDSNSDK